MFMLAMNYFQYTPLACVQVVKRHFRPEFLNRLDDVVVFEPLGKDHLRKIARLQARCPLLFCKLRVLSCSHI